MNKCRWCEEPAQKGHLYCDDLCEKLQNDYWSQNHSSARIGNYERTKRELASKKNKVRSG